MREEYIARGSLHQVVGLEVTFHFSVSCPLGHISSRLGGPSVGPHLAQIVPWRNGRSVEVLDWRRRYGRKWESCSFIDAGVDVLASARAVHGVGSVHVPVGEGAGRGSAGGQRVGASGSAPVPVCPVGLLLGVARARVRTHMLSLASRGSLGRCGCLVRLHVALRAAQVTVQPSAPVQVVYGGDVALVRGQAQAIGSLLGGVIEYTVEAVT